MNELEIISSPLLGNFLPAYNCVQYCFRSNSFKVSSGTKAVFTVEFPNSIAGYLIPATITVAGQDFLNSSSNSYNTVNLGPVQTPATFVQNLSQALMSNKTIFDKFEISVVGNVLTATAREVGIIDDFVFDYSTLAPGVPANAPVTSETQGTEDVFLENYRVIIELWECDDGFGFIKKVFEENRIPNEEGEFCFDFGKKLAPFLTSRLACLDAMLDDNAFFSYPDENISKRFCFRYGEIYSDNTSQCSIEPKNFFNGTGFLIFNGAFQRNEVSQYLVPLVNSDFLTRMPSYKKLCDDTQVFLWINIESYMNDILNNIVTVRPRYIFRYTDGSISSSVGATLDYNANNQGFYAVGGGIPTISSLLNPNKILDTWEVTMEVCQVATGICNPLDASQFFTRDSSCCEADISFCFLNQFGGYDSISFERINQLEIRNEYDIFESFIACETLGLQSGKEVLNNKSFEVFNITSKYSVEYDNREWLRQFLISPSKYAQFEVNGKQIFAKAIFLDTSFIYWDEQSNELRISAQFILNENLNIQKN